MPSATCRTYNPLTRTPLVGRAGVARSVVHGRLEKTTPCKNSCPKQRDSCLHMTGSRVSFWAASPSSSRKPTARCQFQVWPQPTMAAGRRARFSLMVRKHPISGRRGYRLRQDPKASVAVLSAAMLFPRCRRGMGASYNGRSRRCILHYRASTISPSFFRAESDMAERVVARWCDPVYALLVGTFW